MTSQGVAVVLGAGIQGTCAALALRSAGWSVTVLDQAAEPLERTSLRGEGKLHLGYVYANDPGGATAALMLDGALAFSDLIDGWLPEPLPWAMLRSDPFLYGVLDDSMVPLERLTAHYAAVDARVAERMADGARYAGLCELRPVRPMADPVGAGLGEPVVGSFATNEVALRPADLRRHLVDGLCAREVRFRGGVTVRGIERRPAGFAVTCTDAGGETCDWHADVVVNCLWHGRLAVDAAMGAQPERPWSYRLKYGIHGYVGAASVAPPSVTFVLGPFGDVVWYPGGRVYASWYPACMTDWSGELTVPEDWSAALAGDDAPDRLEGIVRRSFDALAPLVPAIRSVVVDRVAAGVIVAWGDRDIDDPASELHRRDGIGVHDHDGYVSIDTGKLTMAPLFADRLATALAR